MVRVEAPWERTRVMIMTSSPLLRDAMGHVIERAADMSLVDADADVVLVDCPSAAFQPPAGATVIRLDRTESPFAVIAAIRQRRRPLPAFHAAAPVIALTDREKEVLELLGSGLRGKDVAASLGISPHTVRTHVQRIRTKLGVHSQVEAVVASWRR